MTQCQSCGAGEESNEDKSGCGTFSCKEFAIKFKFRMSKNEMRISYFIVQISDPCSAGTYRPEDQTVCVPCEEGTVSTETGATSCTSCDPGKQANSDKTLCGEYDRGGRGCNLQYCS